MAHSLLDQTLALLDGSCQRPQDIARGANVGQEWLKKLKAREIADPSVRRIQRLHDYLVATLASKPPIANSFPEAGTG